MNIFFLNGNQTVCSARLSAQMCLAHPFQAKSACASESNHPESCDIGETRQCGSPMGADDTIFEVPTLIAVCLTHLLWKL